MLAASNNVYTTLAYTATAGDSSLSLVSAASFPDKGIIVLAGNADPMVNEVVYYSAKVGNALTGCIRGFDGTTAETHVTGSMCALAVVAKHITDLQPKHGTTAERIALASSLVVDDTGRRFYDTTEDVLYEWVNNRWETAVVMGFGPRIRDFIGTAAEVLPLSYRRGDRWTDLGSASCALRICKVTAITHTMADWVTVGKQGS
jgi:hypothetical protein